MFISYIALDCNIKRHSSDIFRVLEYRWIRWVWYAARRDIQFILEWLCHRQENNIYMGADISCIIMCWLNLLGKTKIRSFENSIISSCYIKAGNFLTTEGIASFKVATCCMEVVSPLISFCNLYAKKSYLVNVILIGLYQPYTRMNISYAIALNMPFVINQFPLYFFRLGLVKWG
jgi:hypothetical protein